jgi:hypothetical protein
VMGPEIERREEQVRARAFKWKAINEVSRSLNMAEKLHAKNEGMHFGYDAEDA